MPTPSHRPGPRTGPVITVIIAALVLIAAGITVVGLFRAEESTDTRAASVGDSVEGTAPPSGATLPGANTPGAGAGAEATPQWRTPPLRSCHRPRTAHRHPLGDAQ